MRLDLRALTQTAGRLSPGRLSPDRLSMGRLSPGRLSPGRLSPGRLSPGRLSPGLLSPGRLSPGRLSPGRLSPGRLSPGRLSPGLLSMGVLSMGLLVTSCGEVPLRPFPDRPLLREDDDRRPLGRAPRRVRSGPAARLIDHQLAEPVDRWLRGPDGVAARNVNALGEVPASSWFTPRSRNRPLAAAALRRGAARTPGPSLLGAWAVLRAGKDEAGPFVVIRDEDERRFLLDFDAPGHPGLATSASLVSTLALHALGFHVPERHLVIFPPDQLRIGPKARRARGGPSARRGTRRLLTEELRRLLAPLPRLKDGSLRAVATRLAGGVDLGPFPFRGTRSDDPNDFVPHELRRELRGLLPVAAWLNLTGITDEVPRDLYDPAPRRRHVVHTLWSLRGSLGSTRRGSPKQLPEGFVNGFSLPRVLGELVTLGFLPEPWARLGSHRALGLARHPGVGWLPTGEQLGIGWAPRLSNEAFARAGDADLAWGARLVASLGPREIRILVAEAYLPKAEAARLEALLVGRRRAVLRAHLGRRAPLDHVALSGAPGKQRLCATDLWHREALSLPGTTLWEVRRRRAPRFLPEPGALLPAPSARLCLELLSPPANETYQVLELRSLLASPHWLRIHLRTGPARDAWRLAGIEW